MTFNDQSKFYFEHRRNENHFPSIASSAGGDQHHGRKILDWGEDGKPIYADGGEAETEVDATVDGNDAAQRELQV